MTPCFLLEGEPSVAPPPTSHSRSYRRLALHGQTYYPCEKSLKVMVQDENTFGFLSGCICFIDFRNECEQTSLQELVSAVPRCLRGNYEGPLRARVPQLPDSGRPQGLSERHRHPCHRLYFGELERNPQIQYGSRSCPA